MLGLRIFPEVVDAWLLNSTPQLLSSWPRFPEESLGMLCEGRGTEKSGPETRVLGERLRDLPMARSEVSGHFICPPGHMSTGGPM